MAVVTIQEDDDGLLTLVVVFSVRPEEQAAHVEHLRAVAAQHAEIDGFVSVSIHRSEDGLRVAEYIQWRSRRHFEAMMATEAAVAHVTDPRFTSDAHVYEVVTVVEAPAGRPGGAPGLTSAAPPAR